MRIKRDKTKTATFGRLGKIKVGERRLADNGKEYPASTDFFIFSSQVPRRVQKIENLLLGLPENKEAGKIVVIPCTFASDDDGEVCSQFYELRNKAGQVVAKGDGSTFYESGSEGYILRTPGDAAKYMEDLQRKTPEGVWRECLVLRVVVLGFDELGTWEFRSYGVETTIPSIVETFDSIKSLAGRVRGIPFRLVVDKQKSNRSGVNRQYPVVNLFCDFSPEGLDNIRLLGANLTGIITAAKLEAATTPELPPAPSPALEAATAPGSSDQEDKPVEEYVFTLEEITDQFLSNYILRTPSDFTEAAKEIAGSSLLSKEEKQAIAKELGAKAQEKGYKWDPEKQAYNGAAN
jgi:hypothetical protein